MAKPQQPELRRSGRVPALDPDASEAELSAEQRPGSGGVVGEAPEEQQPGHHPDRESDKPDLDAFAERLGVASEGDEPNNAPSLTGADDAGGNRWRPQWRRLLVPASVGTGLVLAILYRRRHR